MLAIIEWHGSNVYELCAGSEYTEQPYDRYYEQLIRPKPMQNSSHRIERMNDREVPETSSMVSHNNSDVPVIGLMCAIKLGIASRDRLNSSSIDVRGFGWVFLWVNFFSARNVEKIGFTALVQLN